MDNVVKLKIQVLATAIKSAPVKVEQTVTETETVVTNPSVKKAYTGPSLYKPVEGKTTHPFTLTSVQFIPSANAEFAGDPLKGSVLLYAIGRKTPIGLIPMVMFVSKCVGTGVKREHVLAVSQYIVESKCGVQYAEVGDVLSNGTVVDDTHEDYYITYFDVRFSSQFKNANANIAGGLAMSVSSAYDDINPFDID